MSCGLFSSSAWLCCDQSYRRPPVAPHRRSRPSAMSHCRSLAHTVVPLYHPRHIGSCLVVVPPLARPRLASPSSSARATTSRSRSPLAQLRLAAILYKRSHASLPSRAAQSHLVVIFHVAWLRRKGRCQQLRCVPTRRGAEVAATLRRGRCRLLHAKREEEAAGGRSNVGDIGILEEEQLGFGMVVYGLVWVFSIGPAVNGPGLY